MTATTPPLASLEGRVIRLIPLQESDFAELYDAISHAEVYAGYYGGGPAGLTSGLDEFTEFSRQHYDLERNRVFAVRLASGELVGSTTLGDFNEVREHAHIGWTAYHPRHWGGPVNPEAKLLLLGHAFDHGFGRVKIQTDSQNARSRAAILKLGARFEGILRRDSPRPDGTWRDTAVYSILRDEWPGVRAGLEARLAELRSNSQ